ncbi:MAG: precorrin-6y C5,15-methyltransferase (decarboxylating) subunit CbiE, partial [Xanthobacteraceae bacterium]
MSPADPLRQERSGESAVPRRWLSIVGIGEDGIGGLGDVARGLISDAEIVFGGKRHLALAGQLIRGAARPWPSPFDSAVDEVLALRGRQICVLASGDPFHHGVGAVLARHVRPGETVVVPGPSAFSLAAARLGWSLTETTLVSVHGKALDLIRPHLQPGRRVLALTSDAEGPAALAALLRDLGFGASRVIVLEALGGPRERLRETAAAKFSLNEIDDLNT